MEQVTNFELILLSYNSTIYTLVQALTPDSPFLNNSRIRSTAFFVMFIINYALTNLFFNDLIKTPFYVVTVLTLFISIVNIVIDIACTKKIEVIAQSYFKYYNMVVPVFFAILSIGSLVYLFAHV